MKLAFLILNLLLIAGAFTAKPVPRHPWWNHWRKIRNG